MREIVSHKVGKLGEAVQVLAFEGRSADNGPTQYLIGFPNPVAGEAPLAEALVVKFQEGDPAVAVNGISDEALLAIVEDRLAGFQAGRFACFENEMALSSLRAALAWLQKRTRDRMARGVEGSQVP